MLVHVSLRQEAKAQFESLEEVVVVLGVRMELVCSQLLTLFPDQVECEEWYTDGPKDQTWY